MILLCFRFPIEGNLSSDTSIHEYEITALQVILQFGRDIQAICNY